jgi:hypothetical protein
MTLPTFDTGLLAPQRTLLRAVVVQRLQPLLTVNGGFLKKVASLPYAIGHSTDDISWLVEAIDFQVPAVVVALGKQEYESVGTTGLEWEGDLDVVLYVASGNARDIVLGRLATDVQGQADPTADQGIESTLEIVMRQLVLGQDMGIATTHEFRAKSEEPVITFAEYTLWEQRYGVRLEVVINPNRAVTQQALAVDIENEQYVDGTEGITVETIDNLEAP